MPSHVPPRPSAPVPTDLAARMADMEPRLIQTMLDAGRVVMEVFNSGFAVSDKDDKSPVTEADRRGEAVIREHLTAIAPDIPMIGEEAVSDKTGPTLTPAMAEGLFWLVDPLDGTKEFIKRGTDFTVNIGLVHGGRPIMGLVLAPARNRLYWGRVGAGAWSAPVNGTEPGEKQAIGVRAADKGAPTIVASKSHRSPELEAWLGHFDGADNVSIGSSLKFCLLATGEADLYPRLGPTCEWDTAAAHAVLLAAGGRVETGDGQPLTYGKDLERFLNPWFLAVGDPDQNVPPLNAAE
ncbi:3'(2'),5'-bisphosphate nucleotidase CysQ [Yunchengibacter salinarum]|uniref:3'(2'),5'-bisphosphate nucleotidase CysQ n=1 Tax=Yunchengibacter salinarum TaxID=3133399 RepID=UPI0035B5D7C0